MAVGCAIVSLHACDLTTAPEWWGNAACVMSAFPGTTLNADSLETAGWIVLPGDTLAFWMHDPDGRCPDE